MNVKSHGFDFSLDMNTLAQGLRKTGPYWLFCDTAFCGLR